MKLLRICLFWLLLLFVSRTPANAQTLPIVYQIPIGARPLGLAEAFTALADDAHAVLWNPEGLVTLEHYELNSMYTDLYQTGLKNGFLGLVCPVAPNQTIGTAWVYLGFDDDELKFKRQKFNFAYAYKFSKRLSIGLNFKLLTTSASSLDQSISGAWGVGTDVGVLYLPLRWLRVGATVSDLTNTKVKYSSGHKATALPRSYRLGIALKPFPDFALVADLDDRIHWGIEYWMFYPLALRVGFQKDIYTSEEFSWAAGVGLRLRGLQMDYAFLNSPSLANTHRLSLSFSFGYRKSLIKIGNTQLLISNIYPAYRYYYQQHPIIQVTLQNLSDEWVTAKAELFIPDFMEHRVESKVVRIEPSGKKVVSLTVLFNDKINRIVHPISKRAEIWVRGETVTGCTGQDKSFTPVINFHHRNSWDKDSQKLVYFVTPEEQEIRKLAVEIVQQHNLELKKTPPELHDFFKSRYIFEYLKELGITYESDPHLLYYQDDYVQYPTDLLHLKAGDCDDISILYASLLESIGISTAFIDIRRPVGLDGEGHIFVMFDTGLEAREGYRISQNEKRFIVHPNTSGWETIWIPVEVTLVQKGFDRAWEMGALEFLENKLNGGLEQGWLRIIEVKE
ncbi:hypothetical protein DRP98_03325 [candidate division KSB1 bacterium]|nr:MAG: hypothetical protein DRP98_03325 [candidate division KSB1 bacterium]